jgi:hypothetical protein
MAGRDLPAAPVADGVAAKSACYKDLGEFWVPYGDLIMGTVSANFAGKVPRTDRCADVWALSEYTGLKSG